MTAHPDSLKVRIAAPEDLQEILQIDASERSHDALLSRATSQGECIVFSIEQEIAAVAVLQKKHLFDNDFISFIEVAISHRRQGVGRRLLRQLIEQEGTKKLFTSTNSSNAQMRGLLETSGWTFSGILEGLDEGDPERVYFVQRSSSDQGT